MKTKRSAKPRRRKKKIKNHPRETRSKVLRNKRGKRRNCKRSIISVRNKMPRRSMRATNRTKMIRSKSLHFTISPSGWAFLMKATKSLNKSQKRLIICTQSLWQMSTLGVCTVASKGTSFLRTQK